MPQKYGKYTISISVACTVYGILLISHYDSCGGAIEHKQIHATNSSCLPSYSRDHFFLSCSIGGNNRPLELGGILLTHAHTGHYTGLLQLGKEGADTRDIPVQSYT